MKSRILNPLLVIGDPAKRPDGTRRRSTSTDGPPGILQGSYRGNSSDRSTGTKRTSTTGRTRRRLSTAGESIGFESDGAITTHADLFSTSCNRESRGGVVLSISSLSRAGKVPGNPNKINQDRSWVIESFDNCQNQKFCGVADGHGVHGHEVSEKVRVELGRYLEAQPLLRTDPEAALLKAHSEMNRSIMESWLDVSFSGSTSVSVLIRGSNITCANVGDSRAILGSLKPGESSWQSTALSTDHKPDDPGEQERIIAKKGRVMAYKGHQGEPMGPARVWLKNKDLPGLAMSRSFGDKIASSVGVIAEPTITKTDLTRNDKIIVIASDGVWEFLSNDKVIEIVSIHYENDDPKAAVEDLIHCATDRWKEKEDVIDDITAVVIFLKVP